MTDPDCPLVQVPVQLLEDILWSLEDWLSGETIQSLNLKILIERLRPFVEVKPVEREYKIKVHDPTKDPAEVKPPPVIT